MPARLGLIVALVALSLHTLDAQSSGYAAADSAAIARVEWANASRAMRGDDLAAAQRALDHAAAAWPEQGAYHWGRTVVAARRGDTATTLDALRRYAALGLGRSLADSAFAFLRGHPEWPGIASAHEANRANVARSRVVATLTDSTLWPEGVDVDAAGTFYVGSIRHRTIVSVDARGHQRELIPPGSAGIGAVFGVRVDARRGVVWATHAGLRQMDGWTDADTTAGLIEIRMADGAILRRFTLDRSTRHTPGDLAIAPNGDVLVTDSESPMIHRLRADGDQVEVIRHPLFRSLQGIVVTADGRAAFVADYSHGLLRLDLGTLDVARLDQPGNTTTLGIDGIALHDNAIIAVQNGVAPARIMRFRLDASGRRITAAELLDRNAAVADEPTIGTVRGDEFVYVANSAWEKFAADGTRRPGTALARPVLLAVPLGGR